MKVLIFNYSDSHLESVLTSALMEVNVGVSFCSQRDELIRDIGILNPDVLVVNRHHPEMDELRLLATLGIAGHPLKVVLFNPEDAVDFLIARLRLLAELAGGVHSMGLFITTV